MSDRYEPVRRSHFVPGAKPCQVYAVIVDFLYYPRMFPEFTEVRELARETRRVRVEFQAKVLMRVRFVLDMVCDDEAYTVDWTFVEGKVVNRSEGAWRFTSENGGTRIDYEGSLGVDAPFPQFVLRNVTDAVVYRSLPAMFEAVTREVALRRQEC
jgi:ribosome-associated toxin RatA of RatAB toxin-antitoxin module